MAVEGHQPRSDGLSHGPTPWTDYPDRRRHADPGPTRLNTDRDALAALIDSDPLGGTSPAELAMAKDRAYRIADRILAAGWSRLVVKGGALCECGAGFDVETHDLAKPPGGAHKHNACLYCGAVPGEKHDWTAPHPRMVRRQT